tara:strand:- start:131 stop:316 length:186 start_codon:yes stop_codon:yes gene_type:complete
MIEDENYYFSLEVKIPYFSELKIQRQYWVEHSTPCSNSQGTVSVMKTTSYKKIRQEIVLSR